MTRTVMFGGNRIVGDTPESHANGRLTLRSRYAAAAYQYMAWFSGRRVLDEYYGHRAHLGTTRRRQLSPWIRDDICQRS